MISAVVHTYNEGKNIDRCLNSLTWVDEIVVIDMGSQDDTCKIAKKFEAKIYQHPFTNFVEPARNFGITKANGEWILIVDADEEIPVSLRHFLIKTSHESAFDYFRIPRKNIIFNAWIHHAGWWPDYKIRFFKKGSVEWVEKIHGVPTTKGKGTDIEPFEELAIIHHNYQTLEQFIQRMNRYTTIGAKEYFLANNKFSHKLLFSEPTREFVSRYFFQKGYKDGIHGLGLSFLQAFSELVLYLKVWELEGCKHEKIKLSDVELYFKGEWREKQYWLNQSLSKENPSFVSDLIRKIKRKLHIYA